MELDLNELGANPSAEWPLGELGFGKSGVRLVDDGEVIAREDPFEVELERVAARTDDGLTVPDEPEPLAPDVTLPEVLRGLAGEPRGACLVDTGDVEVLFSHIEAAARTLLGPPSLEAEVVRGFGVVLSVDVRLGDVPVMVGVSVPSRSTSVVAAGSPVEMEDMERRLVGGWRGICSWLKS